MERKARRLCVPAAAAAAALVLGVGTLEGQAISFETELVAGRTIEREIRGHDAHRLTLSLDSGQFAYVSVLEANTDLAVMLTDPTGRVLGWYGAGSSDPLSAVTVFAGTSGAHWLDVHSLEQGASGRYMARLERLEPAAETAAGRAEQWLSPWAREGEPGLAIGVGRHGEPLLLAGYGTANVEHPAPITGRTVFHAASVSKQVVAFAIHLLVEQRALSLDDDVRDHLPWVPDLGHRITLRHLMHHTNGLPGTLPRLMLAGRRIDDVFVQDHALELVRRHSELYFEPGSEFMYTNTGYELLVEVVETVTGRSFADWTADHVFAPLGMSNTLFRDDHRSPIPDLADGYYLTRTGGIERFVDHFVLLGGLGLHSTAEDLLKWLENLDTGAVGGAAVRERMHEPGRLSTGEALHYASGLELEDIDGRRAVLHGGRLWALTAFTLRLPEEGLSVVVLSNRGGIDRSNIALRVAEIFLGHPVRGNQSASAASESPAHDNAPGRTPGDSPEMDDYVGRYEHADFTVEIRRLATGLFAQGPGWITRLVGAEEPESVTLASFPDFQFAFQRNPIGDVVGFHLIENGEPAGDAPRTSTLEPYAPTVESLSDYEGSFRSEVLGSTWTFEARGDELVASTRHHDDIVLAPVAPDRFRGPWFMEALEFRRDASGLVVEVSISQERVRNERFLRIR